MVKLALYRGEGLIGNKVIRWWTDSPYSHCEILVPHGGQTLAFSSSLRDGGVRCKPLDADPEHWDFVDLPWVESQQILSHFLATRGHPYGWLDLFRSQLFNRPSADGRGDFCSEWCAAAIGIPDPRLYSPSTLGNLCRAARARWRVAA